MRQLIIEFSGTRTDDLGAWLVAHYPEVGAIEERGAADSVGLREAIARCVQSASRGEGLDPADVDVVNLFAATPDIPPYLAGGTRQAGGHSARVGQALSELARQAVQLFGDIERGRIKTCDAEDCDVVFYDDSRSNNRRWCSMQRCGNRAKVRKHRARQSTTRTSFQNAT